MPYPAAHYTERMGPIVIAVVALVVSVIVALVCREIVCWYWKVNQGLELLRVIAANTGALVTQNNRAAGLPTERTAPLRSAP